jgi:hypothetical protein
VRRNSGSRIQKALGNAATPNSFETYGAGVVLKISDLPRSNNVSSASMQSKESEIQLDAASARTESSQSSTIPNIHRAAIKVTRAKTWSPAIENIFRYQQAGFKSFEEYIQENPEPEVWPSSGFIKCLKSKKSGFFLYFRQYRECEDRHLNQIKIYSY